MTQKTFSFRVSGKVQGVSFRAATQQQAQALDLRGWVRNCEDGSVELVAGGGADHLAKLEVWLQQGPPAARVDSVAVRELAPGEAAELEWPFAIRRH